MKSTSLTYISKFPELQSKKSSYPALIFLHGRGSDEKDLFELANYFDPKLYIFSIRAPYNYAYGGYTWFDLDESLKGNIKQIQNSCESVISLLNSIQHNYPINPEKIFLFGFSMGAMLALSLGLLYPDRFRGIVAHSGSLLEDEQFNYKWDNIQQNSFFIAHGTFDVIIPIEFSRQAYNKLKQMNTNTTYKEYPIPHTISEESITDIAKWLQNNI